VVEHIENQPSWMSTPRVAAVLRGLYKTVSRRNLVVRQCHHLSRQWWRSSAMLSGALQKNLLEASVGHPLAYVRLMGGFLNRRIQLLLRHIATLLFASRVSREQSTSKKLTRPSHVTWSSTSCLPSLASFPLKRRSAPQTNTLAFFLFLTALLPPNH
jgi:hypothetical protein